MEIVATLLLGGFILFHIIKSSVKMAVKEAISEFKEDIIREFNLKSISKDIGDDS